MKSFTKIIFISSIQIQIYLVNSLNKQYPKYQSSSKTKKYQQFNKKFKQRNTLLIYYYYHQNYYNLQIGFPQRTSIYFLQKNELTNSTLKNNMFNLLSACLPVNNQSINQQASTLPNLQNHIKIIYSHNNKCYNMKKILEAIYLLKGLNQIKSIDSFK
ncbi:hypothetical protein ABPG74_003687 [Tetrahymena malaccensis]